MAREDKKGSSDESNEGYKVDEDEEHDDSEDEYCSFMSEGELDDGLWKFEAEGEHDESEEKYCLFMSEGELDDGLGKFEAEGEEETKDEDNGDYVDDEDDEEITPCDVMKSTSRNPTKERVLKTKNRSSPTKETMYRSSTSRQGKRRSSDYEYTVSEEEREQVKEKELSPSKTKGKEKLEEEKQVCGICLSEEEERTIRGVLNCCSHYFCCPCILEWSKVASSCPLCRQIFTTIYRKTQSDSLKDEVFSAPERDQGYQTFEEELRDYIDPYENVLCTVCQNDWDDAHMLLCDLCDSTAHTYCVGLGYRVPYGKWYCNSCRPLTLAAYAQPPPKDTPDHESQSPRHDSIAFGSAAATLYDRRRIQEHIRRLIRQQLHPSSNSNTQADDELSEEHSSSSSSTDADNCYSSSSCRLKRRREWSSSSSFPDAVNYMEAGSP